MLLGGEPVRFHSPREAIARGIVLIAQELSLVPALSVAENVFLGTEPRRAGFLRRAVLRRRYAELAGSVGFELDGDAPAGRLRTADQQKVEILRALSRDAGLIVMDEPTAALSRPDAVRLHQIIRRLAGSGTTIVLVSHFLREVLDLAQEVTILRDGRVVRTAHAAGETEQSLLSAMLGRSLGATFPAKRPAGGEAPVVLSVAGLSAAGVNNVSLEVRAGEIVGLAGLVGAGRTELARAVQGASPIAAGTVSVAGGRELAGGPRPGPGGRPGRHGSIRRALAAGLAMIPESRQEQGLLPGRSVTENVSLASLGQFSRLGFVRGRAERGAVGRMLGQVDVRAPSQAAPVGTLSGGNQQKVLFARMLLCGPRVLVADEPTRGVDVGAKAEIYGRMRELTRQGVGIVMVSSELPELLGMSDRILVFHEGRLSGELSREMATEQAVMHLATTCPSAATPAA